jgi:DNA-binding beta-propeller fold protein YncE
MITQNNPLIGKVFLGAAIFAALASFAVASAYGEDDNSTFVSTGQKITPTAAPKVGGGSDDNIHAYGIQGDGSWAEVCSPIALGHTTGNGLSNPPTTPSTFVTGGLAVTADGSKMVIANVYNDSVSIVDIAGRSVIKELDLRPGLINPADNGVPGGEYPFWVAIKGNDTAYVSSLRDREIVVVGLGNTPGVIDRIKVKGNPNKMILNRAQNLLFATEDNSDLVEVVDTQTNQVVQSFSTTGPEWLLWNIGRYPGSIPNSLALSRAKRFCM